MSAHKIQFMHPVCIVGIAGYSGSGKTTLIRNILPELKKQGLSVGVIKHVHHKLNIDVRGKDTDHFYRAGADFVFAHDAVQGFARYRSGEGTFTDLIKHIPAELDLIIVEGHKDIGMPGLALRRVMLPGGPLECFDTLTGRTLWRFIRRRRRTQPFTARPLP
jgi:molybdopterin-guanine dinucleotide biosynthesis protein MobB